MKTNQQILALMLGLSLIHCSGGTSSVQKDSNEMSPVASPMPTDASADVPTSPADQPTENPPTETKEPIAEPILLKTIPIEISLPGSDAPSALIKALSLASQVSKVELKVVIDETIFSTTQLTRDVNNPLNYKGEISIPIDTKVSLQAVALDETGQILFEGSLFNIKAKEFDEPTLQIILQRKVAPLVLPPPNTAPIIRGTLIGDASLAYGQNTIMTVSAEDAQQDELSYSWIVVSAPEGAGVDSASMIPQADVKDATFMAPAITGIFKIEVSVSDPSGAKASTVLILYVSETGLDGTPESNVVLSDFPDNFCIDKSCVNADQAVQINFNNTYPDPYLLSTSFKYFSDASGKLVSQAYSANQLSQQGLKFYWSHNCGGASFLEYDGEGNQHLVDNSTKTLTSFLKTDLSAETCQITLKLTSAEGFSQDYVTVLNYSDSKNNDLGSLNCEENPLSMETRLKLSCPEMMQAVPQVIQADFCDNDLNVSRIGASGSLWLWHYTKNGKLIYSKKSMWVSENYFTDYSGQASGSAIFHVIPYDVYPDNSNIISSDIEGLVHLYQELSGKPDHIQAIRIEFYGVDTAGKSGSKQTCVYSVNPDMPLELPADYPYVHYPFAD